MGSIYQQTTPTNASAGANDLRLGLLVAVVARGKLTQNGELDGWAARDER